MHCASAVAHAVAPEPAMTKTIGAILIVLGLCGLSWGGVTYVTREKVID
jgi:hypothetical protein